MNIVSLVGRIAKEIVVKENEKGKVGYFTIAVNRRSDKTDFIPITAFNQSVTFIENYIVLGDLISVTGRVQADSFEKDGEMRYVTTIVGTEIRIIQKNKKVATDDVHNIDTEDEVEEVVTHDENNLPF